MKIDVINRKRTSLRSAVFFLFDLPCFKPFSPRFPSEDEEGKNRSDETAGADEYTFLHSDDAAGHCTEHHNAHKYPPYEYGVPVDDVFDAFHISVILRSA